MSDPAEESDSTYPALQHPGLFKSQIPEHLLAEASPAEKYIMEQLSINTQMAEWAINANMSHDRNIRHTNGRLRKAEANIVTLQDDKKSFITGWRAIAAVAGILSGLVSFLILLYQTFTSGH